MLMIGILSYKSKVENLVNISGAGMDFVYIELQSRLGNKKEGPIIRPLSPRSVQIRGYV